MRKWTEERKKKKSEELLKKYSDPEYCKRHTEWLHKAESYQKNEGKHQLESDEQRKRYQREYHREWYKRNREKVCKNNREYTRRKKEAMKKIEE